MSRPKPRKPIMICSRPARTPNTVIIRTMPSGATPWRVISMANADSKAAAGAQGALISRSVPPNIGATRPRAIAPRAPLSAPNAAYSGEMAEKTVTPKAIAAGKATIIAARPPQKSLEWCIQVPEN